MVQHILEHALTEGREELITTDKLSWTIKIVDEKVVVKCTPVENYEKWECLVQIMVWYQNRFGVGTNDGVIYNDLHPVQILSDQRLHFKPPIKVNANHVDLEQSDLSTRIEITVLHFSWMELNLSTMLLNPIPNISDCQLIIDNQIIYVCKKILAQYSTYFYDLFTTDKDCYHITDIKHEDVMMIVKLIYSKNMCITGDTYDKLSELSLQFGANQCLVECEKYMIRKTFEDSTCKIDDMSCITKFGYKVLDNILRNEKLFEKPYLILKNKENMEEFEQKSFDMVLGDEILKSGDVYRKTFRSKWNGLTLWINFTEPEYRTLNDNYSTMSIRCEYENDSHPWFVRGRLYTDGKYGYGRERILKMCWTDKQSNDIKISKLEECKKIYIKGLLSGTFPTNSIDFKSASDQLSDVVLSVGDKKYHVSRQILAYQSTYFERLFYSNYMESKSSDIELIGIDGDELDELIQHIYDPMRTITDEYIDGLSILADMYLVTHVIDKCDDYRKRFARSEEEIELQMSK